MYSIKMRAAKNENGRNIHISGAEKIVYENEIETCVSQLASRAINHSKGKAESINIKVELLDESDIIHLKALPVRTEEVKNASDGWEKIFEILGSLGVENGREILKMMKYTYNMRGAMLLDVNTLERLEPDNERGVRATYMDYKHKDGEFISCGKNGSENVHFNEALVLATKVVSYPDILAEICFSDDPDYVTGYIASKKFGYVRISILKEYGCADGGRIFLYNGKKENAGKCIEYIEKQPVLVER